MSEEVMNARMSPSDLELLLHYYHSPDEHERVSAPAIHAGLIHFLGAGILKSRPEMNEPWTSSYQVTERGEKFLAMVLNTPYPEHVWADPREHKS